MPIYEYRCEKCQRTFERLRKAQDADRETECPHCESTRTRRLLSSFSQGGGCAAPAGSRFR
jgi:putative FmdB family regulatory protein